MWFCLVTLMLPFLLPCGLPGLPTAGSWVLAAGEFRRHPRSSFLGVMRSDQAFVEPTGSPLRAFPPLILLEDFPITPLTQVLIWEWRLFWALSLLELTALLLGLLSSSPALAFSVLGWLIWVSVCSGLTLPTHLASLPPPVSVTLLRNRETATE